MRLYRHFFTRQHSECPDDNNDNNGAQLMYTYDSMTTISKYVYACAS